MDTLAAIIGIPRAVSSQMGLDQPSTKTQGHARGPVGGCLGMSGTKIPVGNSSIQNMPIVAYCIPIGEGLKNYHNSVGVAT